MRERSVDDDEEVLVQAALGRSAAPGEDCHEHHEPGSEAAAPAAHRRGRAPGLRCAARGAHCARRRAAPAPRRAASAGGRRFARPRRARRPPWARRRAAPRRRSRRRSRASMPAGRSPAAHRPACRAEARSGRARFAPGDEDGILGAHLGVEKRPGRPAARAARGSGEEVLERRLRREHGGRLQRADGLSAAEVDPAGVGRHRPASMRSTVVFPEPFGPTSAVIRPAGTSRSMSSAATTRRTAW